MIQYFIALRQIQAVNRGIMLLDWGEGLITIHAPTTTSPQPTYSMPSWRIDPTCNLTGHRGQSEPVIGLARLLGIKLFQRVYNWNEVIIYRPEKGSLYLKRWIVFEVNGLIVINTTFSSQWAACGQ